MTQSDNDMQWRNVRDSQQFFGMPVVILIASMMARLFRQFKYLIYFSGLLALSSLLVFFPQNIRNIVKTTSIQLNTDIPKFCLHFAEKFKWETA